MGNRALRRQQAKTKERAAGKSGGGAQRAIPRTGSRGGQQTRRPTGGGGILSWRPRFFIDIWNELRKVVWPEREDVMHLTVVIVIVTIIIGAVLGGIDFGFGWLVDELLLN